ncbi:MAG: transcriptional regulator, partial [Elusimicrobia bacterium]|nr:transcriptional regulator [Elusimicrobiota bacterium]
GLPEPEFELNGGFLVTLRRKPAPAPPAAGDAAGQVTKEVMQLLKACKKEMTRQELQDSLGLKAEENFRQLYLVPALANGLIEMTIPDKPKSRLQKYRLTDKGKTLLASLPS